MKNIKRHFLISSLILAVSTIFAKVIGAVYRIPLTNILKSEGIGLYQQTFPIYAFIIVIVSSGFSLALTRECSVWFKDKKFKLAKDIFKFAIKLCVVLSLIFSGILIAISPFISKVQGESFLFWLYLTFSVSIPFSAIAGILRGYFMAKERAIIPAIYNVISQILKLLVGLGLAVYLIKFGILYACLGAVLGISVSEILAFLYLFIMIKILKRRENKLNTLSNKDTVPITYPSDEFKLAKKAYLKAGFLLTIASSIVPLLYMLDGLIIVKLLCNFGHSVNYATICYGELYGVTNSLINLPVMLASSVSLALMPSLSQSKTQADKLKKARAGINTTMLISIFCFVCFLVFAPKIITFLYGEAHSSFLLSKTLLSISSVSVLSLSLIPILGSILQANGDFFAQTISLVIAGILKVGATLIVAFYFNFNIIVLAIINILCFSLVVILNYIKICKRIKNPLIPIGQTLKYLILTCISISTAVGCKIVLSGLPIILNLALSGIIFSTIYILFLFVLKLFKVGNNNSN